MLNPIALGAAKTPSFGVLAALSAIGLSYHQSMLTDKTNDSYGKGP